MNLFTALLYAIPVVIVYYGSVKAAEWLDKNNPQWRDRASFLTLSITFMFAYVLILFGGFFFIEPMSWDKVTLSYLSDVSDKVAECTQRHGESTINVQCTADLPIGKRPVNMTNIWKTGNTTR